MREELFDKQKNQNVPYSLHDAVITELKMRGETVELTLKDGITETREPYRRTGPVRIELRSVDPDLCDVTVLRIADKKHKERLKGSRLKLADFVRRGAGGRITVISEQHGYNLVRFNGFMFVKARGRRKLKMTEVEITVYYFGDMVYLFKEEEA